MPLFIAQGIPVQLAFPGGLPALRVQTQRYTASLRRRDGHTIDGIPGDCLRAAAATVLAVPQEHLRHYAQDLSWFASMRRDARQRGLDWFHVDNSTYEQAGFASFVTAALASGPSPRGTFWHVVVVDADGTMLHDPHPSRAGLEEARDRFLLTLPYFPPPSFPELEPAPAVSA